jgi:beta-glucosidase
MCNNTIVVVHSTGPVLLSQHASNPNVTAILWAGVPGEQSGNSIADVLYGRVNPSAKLPFTLAYAREDYGTDLLYIDYRAFDKNNVTPLYEFGYGLSYTTFSYSNISVSSTGAGAYTPTTGMTPPAPTLGTVSNSSADYTFPSNITRIPLYIYPYLNNTDLQSSTKDPEYNVNLSSWLPPNSQNGAPQPLLPAGGAPGGNPELYDVLYQVRATITNTGKVAGDEVAQLYISLGGPNDPVTVLRGFEKLSIQPGMSTVAEFDVERRDVSNWDPVSQNWFVSNYTKTVYVGTSSRKLYLSTTLPAQ